MDSLLLKPFENNGLQLKNRIVMAPLTRQRAGKGNVPNKMMADYYGQRASAGLIISEGSQISPQGCGYDDTPGIYNLKQVKGWKRITDAVHEKDGKIFIQLWHVGRHSHPCYQPGNRLPVAPSAVKEIGHIRTKEGKFDTVVPHALLTEEIKEIVNDYKDAAIRAMEAGFDGVELHGANGYLIDQFLQDGTNKRNDTYGGASRNRVRFMMEVLYAVCEAIGPEKTGIRLSPSGRHAGISDSNPTELFSYAIGQLNQYQLAFLHLIEPMEDVSGFPNYITKVTRYFRNIYKGTIISCGGYTPQSAEAALEENSTDLIAFGKLFISNPDLVERIACNGPYNDWDTATFYGGNRKGYTDYDVLNKGNNLKYRYCCKT